MTAVAASPARYWEREGDGVVCTLCPHLCRLTDGETGLCGVRRGERGALVTDVYGLVATARPASIESKFLYHVRPGARTLSFAAPGCNLACSFCQNWMVSQMPKGDDPRLAGRAVTPEELVAEAVDQGCEAVACTYTEATVFFEYALDVARLAREAGLLVVWKTNGYTSEAPQREVMPFLDAVNVDLKTFSDETYQQVMGGHLQPVLDALLRYHEGGVWAEVTTLVIPTINDSEAELDAVAGFLLDHLGPDTPWHLTRFHPDHQLRDLPPTPPETLHRARERAMGLGLRYVYTDVEPQGSGWDTLCPGCGEAVVERAQYRLVRSGVVDGRCACGTQVAGPCSASAAPAAT